MNRIELAKAFSVLGKLMIDLSEERSWSGYESGVTEEEYSRLLEMINKEKHHNGWFTKETINSSLLGIASWLDADNLIQWSDKYTWSEKPRKVALIMAGNIPMVGFHDLLAVLFSGNVALCKLSSDDKNLLPAFIQVLYNIDERFRERIKITSFKLEGFDAVIATGSNNSVKYFEQYFGKYPHIFRKNRTSVAVLTGKESNDELRALGKDIFTYFGLGCRNVTYLILHKDFNLDHFFKNIVDYGEVVNHNKYANNYDYNKAVFLLNQAELLDNNFVLLRESDDLFSPLSMIHYKKFESEQAIEEFLRQHRDDIQVIVGRGYLDFGHSQLPGLNDYADNVDTMDWLSKLN